MANARKITNRLLKTYPDPALELRFRTPLQLLIAVILSAQCTDQRVNEVTQELFKRYKTATDYADADLDELQEAIRPTGFYKNKAKTLVKCCRMLSDEHGGEVPDNVDDLTRLPGVGRKTANMVLGNAFGHEAIAVDTHVSRVAHRLGLTDTTDAGDAESELMEVLPNTRWTATTNALILHGRRVCTARKPRCCECALYDLCEWSEKPDC